MTRAASRVDRDGGRLCLSGTLDRAAAAAIWPAASAASAGATVLDVSAVDAVDSAGLALLVALAERMDDVRVEGARLEEPHGRDVAGSSLSARFDGVGRRYRVDVDAASGSLQLHDGERRWRFERVPAYGFHSGGIILVSAVRRHPQLFSALAIGGYAIWTEEERRIFGESYLPPFRPSAYGEHLTWLWNRMLEQSWFFPWFDVRHPARLKGAHDDPERVDAAIREMLDSDPSRELERQSRQQRSVGPDPLGDALRVAGDVGKLILRGVAGGRRLPAIKRGV